MEDATRLDSATALARTPLFSHLGRLDLARLAGELEELAFAPGEVIVREGDPADGFYVITAGRVAVMTHAPPGDGSPLTVLGAGEGFGEIALLTDSPRTATVVAESPVTAWRLSRARFEALLGHERSIAQSIERSLGLRLAATSQEAGALRAVTQAAGRLMAGLLLRREWPRDPVERACGRVGASEALAELLALPGFLRPDGARLVVDRTFAVFVGGEAVAADPGWCEACAGELAAA